MSAELQSKPPLFRLQAFLKGLKTSIGLFRQVLLEVKELLVVGTIILFFLLGVWETLKPKVEPLLHKATSATPP